MMKHATHSPLRPSTLWVILLLAIFSVQACGPQLNLNPTPGGNDYNGTLGDNPTIKDITKEICLGEDADDDALCDGEEEPDCIDDPYCYDGDSIVIDSMSDYRTGAWSRFLTGFSIAAAGAAVVVGVVGASGMAPRKGRAKWGWLNNLIQDNPEADARTFLRVVEKNAPATLQSTLLDFKVGDDEIFYKRGDGTTWMVRKTQLILENKNYGVSINGKLLRAGKQLHMCIGGRTSFLSIDDEPVSIDGGPQQTLPAGKLTIYMKKDYLAKNFSHKVTGSLDEFFEDFCKSENGGIFMALSTRKEGEYFINALHPKVLTSTQGVSGTAAMNGFDYGFTLKYIFEFLPESYDLNSTIRPPVKYRKFNTDVTNGSGRYLAYPTNLASYNDCQAVINKKKCRIEHVLGFYNGSGATISSADESVTAQETQKLNQNLTNSQNSTDPDDKSFFSADEGGLGARISGVQSESEKTMSITINGNVTVINLVHPGSTTQE